MASDIVMQIVSCYTRITVNKPSHERDMREEGRKEGERERERSHS